MEDHTQHIQPIETTDIADNLSVAQENAIELLIQGHNDGQVAETVGVRRATVCDWRNHNPNFRAALNRRRRDALNSHTNRLGHIAGTAIEVLASDLVITRHYPGPQDYHHRQAAAVQVLKAYTTLSRPSKSRPARPASKPKSES